MTHVSTQDGQPLAVGPDNSIEVEDHLVALYVNRDFTLEPPPAEAPVVGVVGKEPIRANSMTQQVKKLFTGKKRA